MASQPPSFVRIARHPWLFHMARHHAFLALWIMGSLIHFLRCGPPHLLFIFTAPPNQRTSHLVRLCTRRGPSGCSRAWSRRLEAAAVLRRVRHPSVPPREAVLPSGCGRRHRPVAPIASMTSWLSGASAARSVATLSLSAGVPWS